MNARSVPVALAVGLLLVAGCARARDSVGASSRMLTAGSAPDVSAPPRQTTTSTATSLVTTSPTIPSTVAAPPTPGGTGEAQMTTSTGAGPAPEETLPTVVPTSAPAIVTTAPEQTATSGPPADPTASSTAAPVAGSPVTVVAITCGHQSSGNDWLVFRLDSLAVNASAAVSGDRTVTITLSPATDATSGTLDTRFCRHVVAGQRTANADGTVVWAITVNGNLVEPVAPPSAAQGGSAYVVRFTG